MQASCERAGHVVQRQSSLIQRCSKHTQHYRYACTRARVKALTKSSNGTSCQTGKSHVADRKSCRLQARGDFCSSQFGCALVYRTPAVLRVAAMFPRFPFFGVNQSVTMYSGLFLCRICGVSRGHIGGRGAFGTFRGQFTLSCISLIEDIHSLKALLGQLALNRPSFTNVLS